MDILAIVKSKAGDYFTEVMVGSRKGIIYTSHEARRIDGDWIFQVCYYNSSLSPGIELPVWVEGKKLQVI